MRNQFSHKIAALACLTGITLVGGVYAQTMRGPASDGMEQLLLEVRALRADLTQAAGASMRMQLLLARLSLQEQRITALSRQSSEVEQQLTAAVAARAATVAHLEQLSAAIEGTGVRSDERKGAEYEISALKSRVAEQQQEEQRLQNQLAELSRAISAEQGRWLDFNTRLDDLERALPTTR